MNEMLTDILEDENPSIELLLVEDNSDHILLTLHALRSAVTNKINVVHDGEEALDYLYQRGKFTDQEDHSLPGLILLDIGLPRLNGVEVLETIKADARLNNIPVCMLTATPFDGELKRCFDMGANSYVSKPLKAVEFLDKVGKIGEFKFSSVNLPTTLMTITQKKKELTGGIDWW